MTNSNFYPNPCQICNSNSVHTIVDKFGFIYLECSNCKFIGPVAYTKEPAVELWNCYNIGKVHTKTHEDKMTNKLYAYNTTKKSHLNNCSKCGTSDFFLSLIKIDHVSFKRIFAYCNVCGAIGPIADTEEKAAELWNIHNSLNKEPTMTDNTNTTIDESWYNNYRKEVENKHTTAKTFTLEVMQKITTDVHNAMEEASKNAPFKLFVDDEWCGDHVYNTEINEVIASESMGYSYDELHKIKESSNNNYIFIKALEAFLKHGFKLYYKQKD